jgi:3-hexulose-6-phosphate synthase/6-phospho-3-hexuloisomerase
MAPILQVALDFVELPRALKLAREAVEGGADWLEAGTPLIKSEGLDAVRRLRAEFPQQTLVADMKTMDAGRAEMEMAAKAGANIAVVLGVSSDATIRECVEAGRNYGIRVAVDLVRVADPVGRARQLQELGVDHVIYHTGIDEQMTGKAPFESLEELAAAIRIPVAVAGGINTETAAQAVACGAGIVIVGGAIIKSKDAVEATRQMKKVLQTGQSVAASLYKRVGPEQVREVFEKVSTPNISDGSHHMPTLSGLRPVVEGAHMVGPALTVRAYPGDWAKPVEAIDRANPGDVIVISAGGVGPALWGELATHSAIQKRVAGVVIDGAVRDTPEIRKLGFPVFARRVMPTAGEPKGFGEIGVPITVEGIRIETGDWIVADDDGIAVIPAGRAVEIANHAMDCLEKENRIREEICSGKTTLAQVQELLKWEKK